MASCSQGLPGPPGEKGETGDVGQMVSGTARGAQGAVGLVFGGEACLSSGLNVSPPPGSARSPRPPRTLRSSRRGRAARTPRRNRQPRSRGREGDTRPVTVLAHVRACVCVRVHVETRRCTAGLFLPHASQTWRTVWWTWEPCPLPRAACAGFPTTRPPAKATTPAPRFGSDSRGCLSLTCVVAPVATPVSLKSCHLTAPGPRHLIRLMPDA